jgi:hypothetical protein
VRQGKIFGLAIPFDKDGPQTGLAGRVNPIHYMMQATSCRARRTGSRPCEFFFVAPPLPITGAVGSPINPQAIK